MILVNNDIISDDLKEVKFVCNLRKCKGACCVDGDAGAPLEVGEISILEDDMDAVFPYMTSAGREVVKNTGVFDYDAAGNMVTPLVNDRECAFANFNENGIVYCAIEKAWEKKKPLFKNRYHAIYIPSGLKNVITTAL